uniref:Uncharacterized protein n=1 Tax=Lotus japonicus TaxID=34305 RepID=I3SJ68_LOTJA|nr:unknown [Lotus japonicus]
MCCWRGDPTLFCCIFVCCNMFVTSAKLHSLAFFQCS